MPVLCLFLLRSWNITVQEGFDLHIRKQVPLYDTQILWVVGLIRIMSIENLQRESSTSGSKHQQLHGGTVEPHTSERVHKPRQVSAGQRKLPMAHDTHEESSTKSGLPVSTPSDYLRRRVLPMENAPSSPHEQYIAGSLNPSQQLQRQHQSL